MHTALTMWTVETEGWLAASCQETEGRSYFLEFCFPPFVRGRQLDVVTQVGRESKVKNDNLSCLLPHQEMLPNI